MSPTVLREDGYRFMIYLNDHPPAHVHAFKGEKEARVGLDPVEVLHNFGFTSRELSRIAEIIIANQIELLQQWDHHHALR